MYAFQNYMFLALGYCDELTIFTFVFHYTLQALPADFSNFKIKVMPADFIYVVTLLS